MSAFPGCPVAKSSNVWGMVKKRRSNDKKTTLCIHFDEMPFITAILYPFIIILTAIAFFSRLTHFL